MPSTNKTNAIVRRGQALQLRLGGASYREIADKLGWASSSGSHKAINIALREYIEEPTDQLRKLELARLDKMTLALATKANAGDTDAIRTSLRIMERRAKLTGLDVPIKVDIRAQLMVQAARFGLQESEAVKAVEELLAENR